ncbi:MAG: hypothetical protein RL755_41 [Pseudomonadota bacterium]|jgi:hypothetical protein
MKMKRTGVKIEASMFDKIKAHTVLKNVGFSEWLANAAIAMYKNETAAPLGKGTDNENQDEHETNAV